MVTLMLVIIPLSVLLGLISTLRPVRGSVKVIALGAAELFLFGTSLVGAAVGGKIDGALAMTVGILCIAWAMFGGGAVVSAVMVLARRGGLEMPNESLPASVWIGVAERAAITISLTLGLKEMAAVVLGVKALGQYQGADNHLPAARVLGTLVSAIWALCCFSVYFVSVRP